MVYASPAVDHFDDRDTPQLEKSTMSKQFTVKLHTGRDHSRLKYASAEIIDLFGVLISVEEAENDRGQTVGQFVHSAELGDTLDIPEERLEIMCIDTDDDLDRDPQPVYKNGVFIGNLYISCNAIRGMWIDGRDPEVPEEVEAIYYGDNTDESVFTFWGGE